MKCKSCGQNLVFDKKSGVARCPDCRRSYKISVSGKPKACPKCHVTLVDKGTFWQCPDCLNKYVFAVKSTENKSSNKNVNCTPSKNSITKGVDSSKKCTDNRELDSKYVLVEEECEIEGDISINLDVEDLDSVLPEPKLYDYDGKEYIPSSSSKKDRKHHDVVTLSKMENREIIAGKKSKVGLFFAVLLGILITVSGIATFLSASQILSEIVEWFSLSTYTYTMIAFCTVFALICIAVAFKPIGAKRIGVLMSAFYGICMVAFIVFDNLIYIESIRVFLSVYGNILTYSIYGLLLLGAFIMMIINCKGEFHRKATSASIAFFVLSLLAILIFVIRMLPLDKYNLEVLESVLFYINGLDTILVMFGSYPLLSVLAKPRQ